MTAFATSSDSYKMPIVLLAIGQPGLLNVNLLDGPTPLSLLNPLEWKTLSPNKAPDRETPAFSTGDFRVVSGDLPPLDERFVVNPNKKFFAPIPMYHGLQEFTDEYGDETAYSATFRLFDPEFDRFLGYFLSAKSKPGEYSVYYAYGWIVDGAAGPLICTPLEGRVLDVDFEPHADGAHTTVRVVRAQTYSLSAVRTNVSFPKGLPPELIAQALIELSPDEISNAKQASGLNAADPSSAVQQYLRDLITSRRSERGVNGPRLNINPDAECEPFHNNGQALILGPSDTPLSFIRNTLLRRSVPKNPALRQQKVYCFENPRAPGQFEWTLREVKDTVVPKRFYYVGRGATGNVLRFQPRDTTAIANQLGGLGFTQGIDASKPKGQQITSKFIGEMIADVLKSTPNEVSKNPVYYRPSFTRDPLTLVQERTARWNQLQSLVYQAEAEIIGDPKIDLLDNLEFNVLAGGTISGSGRYSDSTEDRQAGATTIVPWMSGIYAAISIKNVVNMTGYTTNFGLVYNTPLNESSRRTAEEQAVLDAERDRTIAQEAEHAKEVAREAAQQEEDARAKAYHEKREEYMRKMRDTGRAYGGLD